MGKKGSWFSALKRVFTHNSSDKPPNGSDKISSKEKKKSKGILSHGGTKSFIPRFREPSSIEKILGEADQLFIRPSEIPKIPPAPKAASPRISTSKAPPISPKPDFSRAFTPGAASSKTIASPKPRAEPTLRNQHVSATKIQTTYRGYLARRSFRALKGLVRLQGVVRGQNVKRQTMNALKQMQLFVRVQTQIQSQRIQMLENQARMNDNEVESTLSKWTFNQMSETGNNEDWDDSVLTKGEVEERLQKKVEAVMKRERAMGYAYSHRLWKANPNSAQNLPKMRSNGYPWWWKWMARQPSQQSTSQTPFKTTPLTPPRSVSNYNSSPLLKNRNFTFDNRETLTPRSSRSPVPSRAKQFHTPTRTPPPQNTSSFTNYSKPRRPFDFPLRDDDSLTSCPPFSVPNYMSPTVSAKAKVRTNSNPKERFMGTPSDDYKKRFSFPFSPNNRSFKSNKGSPRSIGDMSVVDSTVSMPTLLGRKPFNRFV